MDDAGERRALVLLDDARQRSARARERFRRRRCRLNGLHG